MAIMKNILSIVAGLLVSTTFFAQAPQKMSYQAVIRNSSNVLITASPVGMRISILQGSETGTAVYVETQTSTTNTNGLVSLEIGTGTVVSGAFTGINWANGPYYIKTETDITGGTLYTIAGTTQLMSVPYALFSANATPIGGFTHYLGEAFDGGIIFYLYKGADGLEHGLIVSLTEGTFVWSNSTFTFVSANRTEDGTYNTNLMVNSPAKTFVNSLGLGWYIPSIDELGLLYYNRFMVQKALRTSGNTLLATYIFASDTVSYWSSTEYSNGQAFSFGFLNGNADRNDKSFSARVRGVKAF